MSSLVISCRGRVALWLAFAFSACVGCGSGLDLVSVRGVVQYDGKPLSEGKILFVPLREGRAAFGQIQEEGKFELMTEKPGDGVMAGRYRATVVTELQVEDRDVHITCTPERGIEYKVEEGSENEFLINVSESEGWRVVADD